MRRFVASAWYPLLISVALAAVTTTAYALLQPTGSDVENETIVRIFTKAGWATGGVMGLLSLIAIGVLNLIRRLVRLRNTTILHPIVALLGVAPWLILSWQITDEPRYTPIARAVIDFVARPMLWGALVACALAIVLALPSLFSKKQ